MSDCDDSYVRRSKGFHHMALLQDPVLMYATYLRYYIIIIFKKELAHINGHWWLVASHQSLSGG